MNLGVLKGSGFEHLDGVINLCSRHGIYAILDLHAAPGGQNTDSDHGSHIVNCWLSRVVAFCDRINDAVRTIDPDHAIFFSGNTFTSDFTRFGDIRRMAKYRLFNA